MPTPLTLRTYFIYSSWYTVLGRASRDVGYSRCSINRLHVQNGFYFTGDIRLFSHKSHFKRGLSKRFSSLKIPLFLRHKHRPRDFFKL